MSIIDVRATYCALAVGAMCCLDAISFKELTDGVGAWVKRCQTYEGAFGEIRPLISAIRLLMGSEVVSLEMKRTAGKTVGFGFAALLD